MGVTLYKHPEYEDRELDWRLYKNLYEGKVAAMRQPDVLWPHQIELNSKDPVAKQLRGNREIRTRYFNAPEIIVSLFRSLFFSGDYTLSTEAMGLLAMFGAEEDITGDGKSLRQFMEEDILISYLLYGRVWVVADNFGIHAETVAQARESGLRPYLESLHPLDVPDWAVETGDPARLGLLNWVRHEYDVVEERVSADVQPRIYRFCKVISRSPEGVVTIQLYRTPSTKDKVHLGTPEAAWEAFGAAIVLTGLTEIPVADFHGDEWLKDAMQETLRYHNLRSNHDNVLYNGGYDRVFVIGVDPTDGKQQAAATEYTFVLLPAGASVATVPPTNLAPYVNAMSESMQAIFKLAMNQMRLMPSDAKGVQGEGSTSAERENIYKLVRSSIIEIESIVNDALYNFAMMAGRENIAEACTISLSKDIKADSIEEFLMLFQAFRSEIVAVPEVYETAKRKVFGLIGLSKEQLDEIDLSAAAVESTPRPSGTGAVDSRAAVNAVMSELEDEPDDEEEAAAPAEA